MKENRSKVCDSFITCQEEKKAIFYVKGYCISECMQCGHRFSKITNGAEHVAEVYSDDYFFKGGDGYPDYLEEKDILYKCGLRYAKIISKYRKEGNVLDVGSAAGFILKGFETKGWKCRGVEPNDTMAEYGRKELGLNITTGNLETFKSDTKFDLINLIQVIGHFYDLDKALQNVRELLNEKGLVLVESWNMKSLVARIMSHRWHEYCPPSVVHWFSDKTLNELFRYYGFEIIAKGYPLKRINLKHAVSLIKERIPFSISRKNKQGTLNPGFGSFTIIYPPVDIKWYIFRRV